MSNHVKSQFFNVNTRWSCRHIFFWSYLLQMMVEVYLGWPGEIQEWKEPKRNYYCCGPMGKSERYSRYKSEFEISSQHELIENRTKGKKKRTEARAFPISSPELLAVVPRVAAEKMNRWINKNKLTVVAFQQISWRCCPETWMLTHNAFSIDGGCVVVGGGGRVEAIDFAARQRIVLLDQRQRVKLQKKYSKVQNK